MEKLRKEVKKLREYARLSVQDRKVLIHKIGTLKDKVHETSVRKSASPLRSTNTTEVGVQCNAGSGNELLSDHKNYWLRFAKLQQKLVSFCEAADLMKTQLEAMCDVLQPSVTGEISKYNQNVAATLTNMTKSSHHLIKSVQKTLEDLRDYSASQETEVEVDQYLGKRRPSSSMSTEVLPDPSEVELPEHPKDALIKHLYEELECKDKDLEAKRQVISALVKLAIHVDLFHT